MRLWACQRSPVLSPGFTSSAVQQPVAAWAGLGLRAALFRAVGLHWWGRLAPCYSAASGTPLAGWWFPARAWRGKRVHMHPRGTHLGSLLASRPLRILPRSFLPWAQRQVEGICISPWREGGWDGMVLNNDSDNPAVITVGSLKWVLWIFFFSLHA